MKLSGILFIFEVFAFVGAGVLLGVGGYIRFMLIFCLAIVLAVVTGRQMEREIREEIKNK